MKRLLRVIGKVGIVVAVTAILLPVLIIGGLNAAKFVIYKDYYSLKTNICKNPGLSDGCVCQGLAADEENGIFLISGYMDNSEASRIYVTNEENESHYVSLYKGGEAFTGHAGGVAVTRGIVYLASESRIYRIPLSSILLSEDGQRVEIGEGVRVNNHASFVFTNEEYLYVGEFNNGDKYVTDHPYDTPEGKHYAIISRYPIDDLTSPDKIYSVRDKVQGACFTPDGKVVLSTSYGITDSVYYVYNEADATDSGMTLDGAPVYLLYDAVKEIKGPAMSEDMDYYRGMAISLSESASDKYRFGKLFFANKIYGLDVD